MNPVRNIRSRPWPIRLEVSRVWPALALVLAGLVLAQPVRAAKKDYSYETDPIRLGNRALEENRLVDAQKHYEEALQNEYQIHRAHFGLAEIHRNRVEYAEAENLYRLAITESQMEKKEYPEARAGLGRTLLRLGRLDEAEAEFAAALKEKSGLWIARYGMARVSIEKGDYASAANYLKEGKGKKGLKDGEDLYRYGEALIAFAQGNLDEAEKLALQAFYLNASDPEYGTLVAQVYTRKGQVGMAIKAYEDAFATPGFVPGAMAIHELGALYQKEQRWNDALEKYREAVQADSNLALAWKDMGYLYSLGNRHDDAAGAYVRYIQLQPNDPEGLLGLAQACLKTRRYTQALQAAEKAVELESDNIEARLTLARAAFANKDEARADSLYATVTDTLHFEADDYLRMAQLLQQRKDLAGAEVRVDKALARDSTLAEAHYLKGMLALGQERDREAAGHLRDAVRLERENPSYWLNLGITQMRLKDIAGAIQSLTEAKRLAPQAVQVLTLKAQAHLLAEQTREAIDEYKAARAVEQQNAGVLRGLGLCYLKLQDYGQATPVLREATTLEPNNCDGWAWYGQALALQNRFNEALTALDKGLALCPTHATAKKLSDLIKAQNQKQ